VYLPETRSERTQPADGPGLVLSSTGLVAVIYGLIQAGQDGWTSTSVLAPVLAGVALLAIFVAWERRSTHPIVDLALFSNRQFTIGAALSTVANFALFGLLFVMPQYFQDVGGSDPLGTGVPLLPMIGGMVLATRIGPMLLKRAGSRFVIIAGLALCAAALGLGATTDVDTSYAFAALWITLLGAGIGLTMPAAMTTAIGALSTERAGSDQGSCRPCGRSAAQSASRCSAPCSARATTPTSTAPTCPRTQRARCAPASAPASKPPID
jgi:MFS transporter, DHA2 family, multidrug resistance protein